MLPFQTKKLSSASSAGSGSLRRAGAGSSPSASLSPRETAASGSVNEQEACPPGLLALYETWWFGLPSADSLAAAAAAKALGWWAGPGAASAGCGAALYAAADDDELATPATALLASGPGPLCSRGAAAAPASAAGSPGKPQARPCLDSGGGRHIGARAQLAPGTGRLLPSAGAVPRSWADAAEARPAWLERQQQHEGRQHHQQQLRAHQHQQETRQEPRPILSTSGRDGLGGEQRTEAAELGTWIYRQYKPAADEAAAAASGQPGTSGRATGAARIAAAASAAEEEEDDDEDNALARAAWRWRFARRWQAEQARQLDPAASTGEDGDGVDDLLAVLGACGAAPWELSRTASDGGEGSMHGRGTAGSVSLLGQEAMLVEGDGGGGGVSREPSFYGSPGGGRAARPGSSLGGRPAGAGAGAATRELTATARRATQLLRAQSAAERAAEARWREAAAPPGGEVWVGALLPAVEVDTWGTFRFVLVRLRDHTADGRQKLLVRGANYASEGKLLEGLHRQVLAAAAARGVPAEPLELVGSGVMEWRRDRDRCLQLHSPLVPPRAGGRSMAPAEVLSLASVLTQQSLPCTYRCSVGGGHGH
ncbi:hypothetical protein Rsub_11649 [Raphidocelis subcapitata]|uniref:Uncharacterized protein n=1 Tax=Raphidocelis subcapitata TaxID=307507 RepID=A0A2V0PNF8_9CHLO|nr:hypothetical protein Rsub_11649 [Raphidocelis subcapitata]|eukprot:GBF98655.1 hypothetical protein Rsub_11649 [Raphidocelis subcapitata]